MSTRLLRAVVAFLLLTGLRLAAPLSTPSAQAAPKLTATPAKPMRGERFTITGSVGGKVARPVELQRRSGGHWAVVATGTTSASGKFSIDGATTASSITLRVVAPATTIAGISYRKVTTATRKVRTVSQKATLTMATKAAVNQSVVTTVKVSPVRSGRTVQLEVQTSNGWTAVATGLVTGKGKASIRLAAAAAGTFRYRAVVAPFNGSATVTSGSRTLKITPDRTVVDPDARVLTSAETASITTYNEDTGTLVLTKPPSSARSISVGDVLPIPPRDDLDSGALRTVTKVSTKGSVTTLTTRDASLAEVATNIPDDASDIALRTTRSDFVPAAGVKAKLRRTTPASVAPASDTGVVAAGSPLINLTLGGELQLGEHRSLGLAGSLTLDPYVLLKLDTDWGKVKAYRVGLGVDTALDATFTFSVTASGSMALKKFELGTLRQSVAGAIGPVPVFLVNTVLVILEVSATGTVSIAFGMDGNLTAGIENKPGSLEATTFGTGAATSAAVRNLQASLELAAFVGPEAEIALYGVAGPFARVGAQLSATFSYDAEEGWDCPLKLGPRLEAGARTSDLLKKLTGIGYEVKATVDFNAVDFPMCPGGTPTDGTVNSGDGTPPQPNPLAIRTALLPTGTAGEPYNTSLSAGGGQLPYRWSAAGLPAGITLNPGNGVLTGTPTTAGTYPVEVTLRDGSGASTSATLSLLVVPPPAPGASAVTATWRSSCALTTNGSVRCWGSNLDGELGDGTGLNSLTPVTPVGLGSGVKQVVSTDNASCALTTAGTVLCWGDGTLGGTGHGATDIQRTPQEVTALPASVERLSAGDSHLCALTSAHQVYCWGYDIAGQVDGVARQFPDNVVAPVHIAAADGATTVGAGGSHTCAIVSGGLICWGDNSYAQLGTGEASGNPDGPVAASGPVAATVLGSRKVTQVGGGYGFTCVVTTDKDTLCWGTNGANELGRADGTSDAVPTPVAVDGLDGVTAQLSVRRSQACARTTGGAVRCWGSIATGDFLIPNYPPHTVISSGVTSVASGPTHACAVTASGGVKCWGVNTAGQLGFEGEDSAVPVSIPGFG